MNDYQLAPTTPTHSDFWTQGGSAVLAPPTQPAGNPSAPQAPAKRPPLTRAHRLLRGRYPVALTLAAAGAVAGAVVGYLAVTPKYSSTGLIEFDPRVVHPDPGSETMNNFAGILANQNGYLLSTVVAEGAMGDKAYLAAYKQAYPNLPLPEDKAFSENITVDHIKGSTLINVMYTDKSPAVAEAAATAVLKTYHEVYGNTAALLRMDPRIKYNQDKLDKIDTDLAVKHREMDDLVKQSGGPGELADGEANIEQQTYKDEEALRAEQNAFQEASETAHGGKGGDPELAYEQIAGTGDRQMIVFLDARYQARKDVDNLLAIGVGTSSPRYQQAYNAMRMANQKVDDYAHEFVNRHPAAITAPLPNGGSGPTGLDVMKQRLDQMQAGVDKERVEANQLAQAKQRVADVQADIARLDAERTQYATYNQRMLDTEALTNTIAITQPGEATLQGDRRKAMGAVGFLFGGLLPVAAMMLYGSKDSRFRYSDEATEADLAGVALLGILPNLPDRLSDPQQAGIAAHCVHQIRTMLQISRANDEPQVIAVTSASTGDGKTSLTLALGLSYAACGARTLLVDCDLLAAGLTHRLNVSSPDGVLEAVANRALLEYVRTTDIADVAILPVGTTHAHHASTLSPVALRRLLSEAKKQFDIVIVDTGPILASIEASLICAAADRTILAVARNQQRPLVERSIGHLQAIGANLAGVVFNRAQARDFEKSMSGLALRSRPAAGNPAAGGNTANGQSVAKAVAGSFKRAG